MKRWILLAGILMLAVGSVVMSERRKVDVPVSPAAFLYLVADTEQELTRMPVTFTRMSDEEEIRIGNELARAYARNEERENTPEIGIIERHLTKIGEQVAANAHRRLPYKFHYLPEPYLVNAFALPGGHVFVGGGLLALMDSEDELAAVLGHEIEHIDHYDCSERVQREQALRKIPLGGLFEFPIELFEAGYSKDQELQADRDGTKLAVEAGYAANGAVRMFETFARLYEEYERRAKTPQEELSRVAQQTLEGYFRSHPLPSERIAQIQKLIASEGWTARPERDLAIAYIFWTEKAENALTAKKYAQAEQLATQSLKLRPDQPKALLTLARARFSQANFTGAAEAYRKILEIDKTSHPEIIRAYAEALAASDRTTALRVFQDWARNLEGEPSREVTVSEAGLELMEGAPQSSRRLAAELSHDDHASAPLWTGELAWWYYLAGDYAEAVELLMRAQQLRPGDRWLTQALVWSLIEVRRYADALQILENSSYDPSLQSDKEIARAVTHWQAQQRDQAMIDFSAVAAQPEWENANWVKALYSPLVAQSIQEMQAEHERREKESHARRQ
ncbi:MAG TPA: M48 family metalloprotease [Terriglobales bacterium]|nr:M48 family metalloprotease [Terriglobales bacterium]